MLKRELFEFLEETADAAFCVNQQGDICSWNEAAERLFGYSASDAIGKSCHGLLQCRGSIASRPGMFMRRNLGLGRRELCKA